MTEDGGCAESFNVITDQKEIAPMPTPLDITESLGLPADEDYEVLFIHKGNGYVHNICQMGQTIGYFKTDGYSIPFDLSDKVWAYPENFYDGDSPTQVGDNRFQVALDFEGTPEYVLGSYDKGDYYKVTGFVGGTEGREVYDLEFAGNSTTRYRSILRLKDNEKLNDVNAIGNTLIVGTGNSLHYILYKDEHYEYLGDRIPIPQISVTSTVFETDRPTEYGHDEVFEGALCRFKVCSNINYSEDTSLFECEGEDIKVVNHCLAIAKDESKRLKYPRFIRYAVRLYDGSHINISAPIMVGSRFGRNNVKFKLSANIVYNNLEYVNGVLVAKDVKSAQTTVLYPSYFSSYRVDIKTSDKGIYAKWRDIVASVDIFCSAPVDFWPNSSSAGIANKEVKTSTSNDEYTEKISGTLILDPVSTQYEKEIILSQTDFRLVKRYSIDDYSELSGKDYYILPIKKLQSETLATAESLEDSDYKSQHKYYGEKICSFNNRILLTGVKRELPRGYRYLNGASTNEDSIATKPDIYKFRYNIRGDAGELFHIWAENINGEKEISTDWKQGQDNYGYINEPYTWLTYPDRRCFSVDIIVGTYDPESEQYTYKCKNDVPMSAAINGDFSYLFLEIGTSLKEYVADSDDEIPSEDENITESLPVKIAQSAPDNPFLFTANGIHTLYSKVLNVATITKALSSGQFGQFPLYVFTEDGIWVMETGNYGTFVTNKPLSRDVALSADCIISIDQAIVFTTDKGVMLLTGSDIQNISPNMLGKHYTPDVQLQGVLDRSPFSGIVESDTTPFMDYMRTAKCAYDYTGQRLLFFNANKDYQYVYKLNTNTWHKTATTDSGSSIRILNSYPDCFVATKGETVKVLNFSATLETDGAAPMKGIIITRPFDLGYSDVRKVIKSIRIRGYFNRNDVKYILQGSMDGIHWGILPSLHSGSFKLFRLVLMADLSKDERVSWIDVDFETRFNGRLR